MDRRAEIRRWLLIRDAEGLTFRELSRRSGIAAGTLGFWSWKLRREGEPEPCAAGSEPSAFVELVAGPVETAGRIEIVLARDRRLLVDAQFDEAHLVRVIRALEQC